MLRKSNENSYFRYISAEKLERIEEIVLQVEPVERRKTGTTTGEQKVIVELVKKEDYDITTVKGKLEKIKEKLEEIEKELKWAKEENANFKNDIKQMHRKVTEAYGILQQYNTEGNYVTYKKAEKAIESIVSRYNIKK